MFKENRYIKLRHLLKYLRMHFSNFDKFNKTNPWYNDDCKEAIKQRKQALSKFKRYPNTNNFNDIKVLTIKISKRKS